MIDILCPTRKRPHNMKRLVQSVYETTRHPPAIHFYVDEDDMESIRNGPILARYMLGPRIVMSMMWNKLAEESTGDICMLCGDDVVFRTEGWDELVEQEFALCPDKILMVYGDDLSERGKEFATLPFVSRRWIDTVGYFTPPGFSGDFSDTWIDDVATMIGRKRFLPFIVEHLHPVWGKAPMDETYQEKLDRQLRDNHTQMYKNRLPERVRDAKRLRKVMQ